MAFDIESARKAGYTDAEIADHLASSTGFDVKQARAAKYSDAEIIQHLTSSIAGGEEEKPPAPEYSYEDKPGVADAVLIGAGRTFDRIGKGMQQIYNTVTGDKGANETLAAEAAFDDKVYAKLKKERPLATGFGEALPSLAIPGGVGATAAGTAVKLGAVAAVPAALEYGSAKERFQNAATAATSAVIGGVAVPKLLDVTGNIIGKATDRLIEGKVAPAVKALSEEAARLGIPVSRSQLSDSKFVKTLASVVDTMPFSGATKTAENQQKAFNRAVAYTFGENTDTITRGVYASARERLGKEFERLSSKNDLNVTPTLMSDVNDVILRSSKYAKDETGRAVLNLARDLRSKMDTTAMTVPGKTYQSIDSEISRLLKGAQGDTALYLGELQEALRKGMDASMVNSADAAAWKVARQQYANLKTIRDIVAKEGADGNITPALLMSRLNASNSGKESMAKGTRGQIGDIAAIGKQFMRPAVPNSGTAQRMAALGLLGGGGYAVGVDPHTLGAFLLAGATTGRAANKLLNEPANMSPRLTLNQILTKAPGEVTARTGAISGMTLADLLDSKE